jgi:hypothetical protein
MLAFERRSVRPRERFAQTPEGRPTHGGTPGPLNTPVVPRRGIVPLVPDAALVGCGILVASGIGIAVALTADQPWWFALLAFGIGIGLSMFQFRYVGVEETTLATARPLTDVSADRFWMLLVRNLPSLLTATAFLVAGAVFTYVLAALAGLLAGRALSELRLAWMYRAWERRHQTRLYGATGRFRAVVRRGEFATRSTLNPRRETVSPSTSAFACARVREDSRNSGQPVRDLVPVVEGPFCGSRCRDESRQEFSVRWERAFRCVLSGRDERGLGHEDHAGGDGRRLLVGLAASPNHPASCGVNDLASALARGLAAKGL